MFTSPRAPTIGRIVFYTLTSVDAERVNRRRTTSRSIAERLVDSTWPQGAQAHIGNDVRSGDMYPAVITRVWPVEAAVPPHCINAQVLLDGNDQLWVTLIPPGDGPGQWSWPPRS